MECFFCHKKVDEICGDGACRTCHEKDDLTFDDCVTAMSVARFLKEQGDIEVATGAAVIWFLCRNGMPLKDALAQYPKVKLVL